MGFRSVFGGNSSKDVSTPSIPDTRSMLIGVWYKPEQLAQASQWPTFIGLYTPGTTDAIMVFQQEQTTSPIWQQTSGGYTVFTSMSAYQPSTAPPLGKWNFSLLRVGTNYLRASNLLWNGQISNTSADGTIQNYAVGPLFFGSDGGEAGYSFAEFFICSSDPFAGYGSGFLPPSIIRQIAYHGPFSMPNVASKMRYYRSFLAGGDLNGPNDALSISIDRGGLFTDGSGQSKYTLLGDHPPLAPNYVRPRDFIGFGMI
jgi:hypothetical protein